MAASTTLPALVLRDAILRIAPQDEGSENGRNRKIHSLASGNPVLCFWPLGPRFRGDERDWCRFNSNATLRTLEAGGARAFERGAAHGVVGRVALRRAALERARAA